MSALKTEEQGGLWQVGEGHKKEGLHPRGRIRCGQSAANGQLPWNRQVAGDPRPPGISTMLWPHRVKGRHERVAGAHSLTAKVSGGRLRGRVRAAPRRSPSQSGIRLERPPPAVLGWLRVECGGGSWRAEPDATGRAGSARTCHAGGGPASGLGRARACSAARTDGERRGATRPGGPGTWTFATSLQGAASSLRRTPDRGPAPSPAQAPAGPVAYRPRPKGRAVGKWSAPHLLQPRASSC